MTNSNSREQKRQSGGSAKAANERQLQQSGAADKKLNGPNRPST